MGIIIVVLVLAFIIGFPLYLYMMSQNQPKQKETEPEIEETTQSYTYTKKCLMTATEKKFFAAIKNAVGEDYTILPQINLATIIEKQGDFKYQNELYRNIDFGVFDKDYNCVLLIEINDETHNEPKRKKRDAKVKEITQCAGITLIPFYTKYGVNQDYITKRIKENI